MKLRLPILANLLCMIAAVGMAVRHADWPMALTFAALAVVWLGLGTCRSA